MSPGRIDRDLVRRQLAAMQEAVSRLRKYAGKPVEALAGPGDHLWAVERGLQLCAQNALDLATHITASAGRDAPDSASAIDGLADLGVVTPELAARFRGVAGFRTALVHAYLRVDPLRVHAALNERLEDFAELARRVEAHVERAA